MLVLGPSLIVMLLFYLVELANSFPSHFIEPSIALNEFIKHYELASYNPEDVANQHKRIRRATTSAKANSNQPLKLTIKTSKKVFKLVLRPDEYLFTDDVVFEGENGKMVNFDRSKVYVGTLDDDERTKVRGIITKDGLFDGTISTQFEEFYVEPISRYKDKWRDNVGHTIVYKTSDVTRPDTPVCSCSSNSHSKHKPSDLNTIARRSKRNTPASGWPKFDNLLKRGFASNNNNTDTSSYQAFRPIPLFYDFPSADYGPAEAAAETGVDPTHHHHHHHHHHPHHRQNASPKNSDNIFYDLDLTVPKALPPSPSPSPSPSPLPPRSPDDQNFSYEYNDTIVRLSNNRAGNSWRPKNGGNPIDTVYKYAANISKTFKGYQPSPASVIPHKNNPKILVGSGGGAAEESRANLIITSDDSTESHTRKRAIVDPKKTTCMLYLQADHLFLEKYGTEETCIEVMTRHVQRVNSIYRNTDFNLDGKPDNISFMIKRIKVHSSKDSSYRFPGNYGVEKFLEIFSEDDYDAFCLAYMFTYRDFEMGTLGLAWTGDLKNAGGVCEKNGHYRGSMKSLNTGIVTVLNYGKHVPSAVSHVTLAHEIGHNFGSPHDPDGCTPGGDDGNFIMFARATSGDKKNNNRFSPCSLNAINPVLNVKARSAKGCFTEPQKSICGNGVVEADEECDCGWEEDCKDSCCYPQRRHPPLDEPPCHLTPKAVCSPSQGPCCTTECKIKSGDICRSDNGCRDSSYCNGISAQCPPSINKPNKTVCNEEYVCYMGECTGSICLAYGLESCQCIPTASDLPTKACELCCKLPGENQPCLSSFQWNQAPYDVPDMFAKPGTPCNDYNGYCDVFRKCREVDPSGPIATLRKLLLSEENIASFKKWAYDHWYYCGLIFIAFLLVMAIATKLLGKKSKVKSVTVVHSSPTETVRLPDGDGAAGGPAVVVHPTVVRTKLPLKKKVREKRRAAAKSDENAPRNVNNNNSPVEAKKKKRESETKSNVKGKSKARTQKNAKKETQVGASNAATGSGQAKVNAASTEDPLGKVRNWLINSHNMDSLGSLKKSKSSPASFDLSDANGVKKRQKLQSTAVTATADASATAPVTGVAAKPAEAGKTAAKKPKDKDGRVKLQVVYKPPFKFSVKLGKQKNEISSQLIKDKRPEAVKQRAALLIRADRIRANATSSNAATAATAALSANANNDKGKGQCKSKNSSGGVIAAESGDKNVAANGGGKSVKIVEYKRSVSAPQSTEPVYENTVFEGGAASAATAADETANQSLDEPHYVNLAAAKQKTKLDSSTNKSHWPNASNGGGAGVAVVEPLKNTFSSSGAKPSSSNDFRSSLSKPSTSSTKTFAKRRNSYDVKHAPTSNNEPPVQHVKRQHSDETDVISAAARDEFKRRSVASVKRTSSGDTKAGSKLSRSHQPRKSTSHRKSYHDHASSSGGAGSLVDVAKSDGRTTKRTPQHQPPPSHQAEYNLISFGSPSFDRMASSESPKRKTSYDPSTAVHDSQISDTFSGARANSNRSHVTRTASNSTRRKAEGDKFKRFSLQNPTAASAALSSSGVPKTNIVADKPSSTTSATIQFVDSPLHQQQYDIPSDLEVLLSETENPADT